MRKDIQLSATDTQLSATIGHGPLPRGPVLAAATRRSRRNSFLPLNDHRAKLDFLFLLEALLEERNVHAAADRLGLSQPALSHALARLRERFDDPLFVKTPSGMQPTPLAARLASSSKRALDVVRNEILNTMPFEPRATARIFVVCLSEMGEAIHLHRIVKRFGAEAPNARIRLVHFHVGEIAKKLETGDIDLAVGYYPELNGGLFQQTLFRCKQVCIVRADHPRIADTLSLRQFVETPHVVATPLVGASHYVDQVLKKKNLRREVGLEVPYLSSLPNLVANSDFIALIPAELAELYKELAALRVFDPPVKVPLLLIKQFWHGRFNADPQNKWLRSVVGPTPG